MSRFAPLIITLTLAWLLIPAGPALAGDATPGIIYTGIAGLIAILGLTLALLKKKLTQTAQLLETEQTKRNAAETSLATTLSAIGEGVIATDEKGRITLMNKVAQDLTGWPPDQAQGLQAATVFHAVDAETGNLTHPPVGQALDTVTSAAPEKDPILISRGGARYHVRTSAIPVCDGQDRIKGSVMVFRDITDSVRLEAAAARKEAYLESIIRAAPAGIGVVSDRKFTHVNRKILDMTGYLEEELLGKSARILYPSDSEYQFVGEEKYRQISQKGTGTVETRWQKKDGTIIHVLLSSTPMDVTDLSKGVTFSALDITQKKEADLRLKKSEAQYRTLFEKTNDAIFLLTPDTGAVVDGNRAALDLTGLSLEALKQTTLNDIAKPWGPTRKFSLPGSQDPVLGNFAFTTQGGQKRIAKLSSVSLNEHIIICIAKDVTQDLQMEKQLRQAQKMESIGTLAGGIAHDFNNILFPILGFSEMLLEDLDQEDPRRRSLDQIYASAMRAKELVGQILAFSRQSHTDPLPIKIQPIIKEALKLLRATIPTTIEIRETIARDCGVIKADPTQIHQVLINLTTNAYHAMEASGGTLGITLEKKGITAETEASLPQGKYACLTIEDTGPGIPEDIRENIFDPFFTTKEKGKGTGMGLAVVHGIVAAMNGTIRVDSRPGEGTAFSLYFPIEDAAQPAADTTPSAALPKGKERVLLVDDEPEIIAMETQILERLGYQVTAQTSSLSALDLFVKDPDVYDLVISDVAMPGMAGDRLAKSMLGIRPDIPILLCTGFSDTITKERAEAIGAKGFILKPMIIEELSRTIRRILDQAGQTRLNRPDAF